MWERVTDKHRKNGTYGILCFNGRVVHGTYEIDRDPQGVDHGAWFIGDEGFRATGEPTHFMPWPPPPQEEGPNWGLYQAADGTPDFRQALGRSGKAKD